MTDEELLKVADLVYAKLEDKFHALDGVVGARGRRGEDGKQGERGLPGRDADRGPAGQDGYSTRIVIVYKLTEDDATPAPPTGGSWDFMTNKVTPPDGWTEAAPNHETGYLWQSQAIFSTNGDQLQAWTQPFRLNSKDGSDGADSFFIEYVYKLTADQNSIPTTPSNNPDVDDWTGDWSDNPKGITEELRCEWVCSRQRNADGKWGNWIGPTIWSVWGNAGKDGDGMQYVYKLTETKEKPADIVERDPLDQSEWVPTGWTDDPTGVSEEMQFEWVSQRKFNGIDGKWGEWTSPRLWATWGQKGDTGLSVAVRYQAMVKDAEKPVIEDRKRPEPGDQWSKLIPELEPGKVIWCCQALVYENGTVYCDPTMPEEKQGWQGPWIISGANGDRGKRGIEPDYPCIVFKQDQYVPEKPNGTDPKTPGNGWATTIPQNLGTVPWWGCWGQVTHLANPVYDETQDTEDEEYLTTVSWGSPIRINGVVGQPCVLASFQATIPRGSSSSWTVSRSAYAIGVEKATVVAQTKFLGKVNLTPSAGYSIEVTSVAFNCGECQSTGVIGTRFKSGDEHKTHGTSFMYAPHAYIDSDNSIYLIGFCQRDGKDSNLWAGNWDGTGLNTFTLTVFGKVTATV